MTRPTCPTCDSDPHISDCLAAARLDERGAAVAWLRLRANDDAESLRRTSGEANTEAIRTMGQMGDYSEGNGSMPWAAKRMVIPRKASHLGPPTSVTPPRRR